MTTKAWSCDVGDAVEFNFSDWAKTQGKKPLHGKIVGREQKFALIKIDGTEQIVKVHISLVSIIEVCMANKVRVLSRKFETKPSNKKGKDVPKEVTHEVGGMKFQYKKKK